MKKQEGLTTAVVEQRIQETERELSFILGKVDALSALLVSYRRILQLDAQETAAAPVAQDEVK